MLPFIKEAIHNVFTKPSTVEYPNKVTNVPAKPNYRGRIAYDVEKCLDCGQCIRVCSPAAITRIEEETEEGKKFGLSFDMGSCTFCGTCQDFCDSKAVTLTEDYHIVGTVQEDMVVCATKIVKEDKGDLICGDDCIFCGLCAKKCPQGAITVDRASKTWAVDNDKCIKCGICVGKCPKKTLSFAAPAKKIVKNDVENCIFCGLCAKKCPQEAITVDRASKSWTVDEEKCIGCGICVGKCPKKTLSL